MKKLFALFKTFTVVTLTFLSVFFMVQKVEAKELTKVKFPRTEILSNGNAFKTDPVTLQVNGLYTLTTD
ncbi:MAG: hypothetical protein D8H99_53025, partial [Streptococcus sp.]